ncbi:MAG: SusD/RagB family nutrient-binding outer membrane lipoprotein [Saprospiraceae bacterium]|nr:SusD/RagB family nutrient-binding outer membrane lipoprotein [Saprospiraceae bacterium]
MKKLSYILAALLLMTSSCKKFVEGYDVSPNSPVDVPVNLLLPSVEVSTFAIYTGQLARVTAIFMKQQKGRQFQYEEYERYDFNEGDIDNDWWTLYDGSLINAQLLIDKAGDKNPHYRGIGRILKAMNLGIATDFWGDVPNKEALQGLKGPEYFNAAHDPQEQVIADIQKLLDDAIVDLKLGVDKNVLPPANDDYIFGGDANKWIATAYVVKARYANRLSKKSASGSATTALGFLTQAYAAGFTSNTADCMAKFGAAGNEWNQWYAFNKNRGGYMTMNGFFVDMMKNASDPRLAVYAGSATATENSVIGAFFASQASSMPLVTYAEAKFIEAEAQWRVGDKAKAAAAHNAAVKANILKTTGAANATYEAINASETDVTLTLQKIMTQKYIAMFTQPEVWSDWRRTNIPALTPNANAAVAGIPRRFPTAQSERLYNTKATVESNILTPIWWDK